jgi:hypothetical protein
VTAQITTLIDGPDNAELVRDTIAAILLVECDNQQVLARNADKDPELWRFRVFVERSNPWDEFLTKPPDGQQLDKAPIVNVRWDKAVDDEKSSNVVDRQKAVGTFHIDCYGYGVSSATEDGHESGDERAAEEAQRAARLVRRILMAGAYTYLGLRKTVWRRWRAEAQAFEPPMEQRSSQHVQGVRVSMRVEFNEFSPQVEGTPLSLITVTVNRADNGELILFQASFPQEQPTP